MCIRPAAADAYQQRGFDFDEIWAWELGAVDPTTFWASIPDHIVPKLHFYNSGVDADFKSPANPVNIIRYGGQGRLVSSAATLPIRYTDACRLLVGTALASCSMLCRDTAQPGDLFIMKLVSPLQRLMAAA